MQAAFEVLKGTISATSAMSKYRVNRHSLRYYKTRLVKDGVAEIIASVPEVARRPTARRRMAATHASGTTIAGPLCKGGMGDSLQSREQPQGLG